jgi:transcriptional regulator with XRE-family HTH domain
MEIQHIIANKRAEKGFGQEYLAEKVDACDREVRRWEHKTEAIQIQILYLYRLAKIFDCSIHDLLPDDRVYGVNWLKAVNSREKPGNK